MTNGRRTVHSLLLSLRDLVLSVGPLVFLVALLVVLAFRWLDPNPPKRVVLATGPDQSAYAAFGQRYATALARHGIELVLQPSQGSSHNLALLRGGEVDMGFVQGGSVALTEGDREALVSLGACSWSRCGCFTASSPHARERAIRAYTTSRSSSTGG